MMKNIFKIICLLLFAIKANCQQVTAIVPLGSYDFPNGAYLKDINSELNPYVGTWEGVINNIKYTFMFQIFPQHLNTSGDGSYYYRDSLKGKFKAVNLNTNQTLYDNLSAINYNDYNIDGLAIRNGNFAFSFLDSQVNCHNLIKFILQKINGQPNQLKYCYFTYEGFDNSQGCSQYTNQQDIPMFLPKVDLVLTKL